MSASVCDTSSELCCRCLSDGLMGRVPHAASRAQLKYSNAWLNFISLPLFCLQRITICRVDQYAKWLKRGIFQANLPSWRRRIVEGKQHGCEGFFVALRQLPDALAR